MKPRDLAILFFLLAFAMLFYSFVAHAGCLTRDQAFKTWPTRELTRDDDGCWTYWRKPLRHEFADPTGRTTAQATAIPGADGASKGADALIGTAPLVSAPTFQWLDRWPETHLPEYQRVIVERDPPPFITTRLVVIIAVSISLTLAVIEVLWGDKIIMKIKERNDGYWT